MEVKLKTRLMARPMPHKHMNMIQIGTTACFTFDLNKSIIPFNKIAQLTFMFKQGDTLKYFDMFDGSSEGINEQFEYDKILNEIIFTMTPEDTLSFEPSHCAGLVDYEVVVVYDNNTTRSFTFADEDDKIFVLNSLYKDIIEV